METHQVAEDDSIEDESAEELNARLHENRTEIKGHAQALEVDAEKVNDAVLALLYLNRERDGNEAWGLWRAWRGMPRESTDCLFERGLIHNPVNKNKSVVLTSEGLEAGREAARRLFGHNEEGEV